MLAGHAPTRNPMQFGMDEGHQLVKGRLITLAPRQQQPGDLSGIRQECRGFYALFAPCQL
jgi:hypothetical protein